MEELDKLRKLYQLKNVDRMNSVGKRKESTAEHTWSSLILADYVISKFNLKLDRLKIFELLLYHNVVEIEAGDIPIHHIEERKNKKKKEQEAFDILHKNFPSALKEKFAVLFNEFEEQKTKEARFSKAIDNFDAWGRLKSKNLT